MPLLLDRPRSTTEILDAAFLVTRAHYATMVGAYALLLAPRILARLWLPDVLGPTVMRVLALATSAMANATIMLLVSALVTGEPMSTRAAMARAVRRLPALTAAHTFIMFVFTGGLAFLVVPGPFILAATFAIPAAIIIEGRSLRSGYRRASDLAKGQLVRLAGGMTVSVVLAWALQFALQWALGHVAGMLGGDARASAALGLLGGALVAPFGAVAATLFYYDLRIRKEAFDLELLARDLPPVPAVAPLAAR